MSAIGSIFSTVGNVIATNKTNETNLAIARDTNRANLQIAEETNTTQRQIANAANALQIEENEKAYQRSTATNQIAELIKTGLSEQQARQIVAGNGNPATYQPASIQQAQMQMPTMQVATMQSPDFSALGAIGQDIPNLLDRSYTAPDGGFIGNAMANDSISFASNNIDLFAHMDLASYKDFEAALTRLAPGNEKVKNFMDSQDWKRVQSNVLAQRAFTQGIRGLYDSGASKYLYESAKWQATSDEIESQIKSLDKLIMESNLPTIQMDNEWKQKQIPYLYSHEILNYATAIQNLRIKFQYQNTEHFQKYALQEISENQRLAASLAYATRMEQEVRGTGYDSLTNDQKIVLSLLHIYHDAGITSEKIQATIMGIGAVKNVVNKFEDLTGTPPVGEDAIDLLPSYINYKAEETRKSALQQTIYE